MVHFSLLKGYIQSESVKYGQEIRPGAVGACTQTSVIIKLGDLRIKEIEFGKGYQVLSGEIDPYFLNMRPGSDTSGYGITHLYIF